MPTSLSLLDRLQSKVDPEAWEDFVRLYGSLLFTWTRRKGLSEVEAADLVQDVFFTVAQKIPTFHRESEGSFRRWLRTILLNRWRTINRKNHPRLAESDQLEQLSVENDPALPTLEQERDELIRRALAVVQGKVEPNTWKAFQEHFINGRRAAEVASELGISANVVYLARSRVMKMLRELLSDLLE